MAESLKQTEKSKSSHLPIYPNGRASESKSNSIFDYDSLLFSNISHTFLQYHRHTFLKLWHPIECHFATDSGRRSTWKSNNRNKSRIERMCKLVSCVSSTRRHGACARYGDVFVSILALMHTTSTMFCKYKRLKWKKRSRRNRQLTLVWQKHHKMSLYVCLEKSFTI